LDALKGCLSPPQALIGTAIGLPPQAFRLLLQSNGATTAICFAPAANINASAVATVEHINQVLIDQDFFRLDDSQPWYAIKIACTASTVARRMGC
jgi:hypothetical protein